MLAARGLILTTLAILLAACASSGPVPKSTPADPPRSAPPTIPGTLEPYHLLEITVLPFDALSGAGSVRAMESRLFAWQLRKVLEESSRWGAVRMLPESDAVSELVVSGRITASDGQRTALMVRAVDSTGRLWLEREYAHTASAADYPDERVAYRDPFRSIYHKIASDLEVARARLDQAELLRIQETAQLRYAAQVAPQAFGEYVSRSESGWIVNRLPAQEDPVMARVLRVRNAQFLFVDTLDQNYGAFYREVYPGYSQWRRLSFEERVALQELQTRGASDRRGFGGMHDNYRNYREIQLAEDSLRDLLDAIRFEAAPTEVSLEDTRRTLEGTIEEQYREWRELLDAIYRDELGL